MINKLEKGIHNVLDEHGITLPNWRIEIINKVIVGYSDWAKVTVGIYKPRCRKPTLTWILAINMVRNIVDFDKSSFFYNNIEITRPGGYEGRKKRI